MTPSGPQHPAELDREPERRTYDSADRQQGVTAADEVVPAEVIAFPPNQYSVEAVLERIGALVAEGEIESLGIAIVKKNGGVSTTWSRSSNVGSLIGAASLLQHRLCEDD